MDRWNEKQMFSFLFPDNDEGNDKGCKSKITQTVFTINCYGGLQGDVMLGGSFSESDSERILMEP